MNNLKYTTSAQAAAMEIGVPVPTIKVARKVGCPAIGVNGRYNIPELREWLLTHAKEIAQGYRDNPNLLAEMNAIHDDDE